MLSGHFGDRNPKEKSICLSKVHERGQLIFRGREILVVDYYPEQKHKKSKKIKFFAKERK